MADNKHEPGAACTVTSTAGGGGWRHFCGVALVCQRCGGACAVAGLGSNADLEVGKDGVQQVFSTLQAQAYIC